MPETNSETLVTGAGDCEVRVHNLLSKEIVKICTCHTGRVKRLATSPSILNVFWSAGEDGLVRQYDLRMPHTCDTNDPAILVDLKTHCGEFTEAKCLSVNPMKPELIAVGANDPYIRLYDRRMIKLVKGPCLASPYAISEDNLAPGCVKYFAPGHIAGRLKIPERILREYSSTYVTFGPNGNEILANIGSEQIYLYDINTSNSSLLIHHTNDTREINEPLRSYCFGFPDNILPKNKTKFKLPERINALKLTGNSLFEKANYAKSMRYYNEAIGEFPYSSVFYSNRAAALMKREWPGDTYAALRDCITSLEFGPNNAKAYFRMIRCLFELGWVEESRLGLDTFKQLFPSYAKLVACRALERDIDSKLLENENEHFEDSNDYDFPDISSKEYAWRENAKDYMLRFYGHCNTTTDIKEANFFGSDGNYIVAGSDDGSIFIWDRKSTNNIRILKGDSSIVNCVQPHPTSCLLATSGIETRVRLWSPHEEDDRKDEYVVPEMDDVAEANQRRMQTDPFDIVVMNMSFPGTNEVPVSHHDFVTTYGCHTS
ncbi:hypothetical protein O3M35_004617 [Rhynocoris fuscipes]|uniref:WD and tetratricopeptide repeats protein 1 n=1 Tax=Rhynocoris fuscipes TaxID=488301 RepID=A0AAW1CLX9_9HEMI